MIKFTAPRSLIAALLSLTSTGLLFSADTSSSSLDQADQTFVANAALSGRAEVQVSELAVRKAASPAVKAIAVQIVKDHKAVNTQISDLAKAKGLTLTAAGNPDADEVVADLEKDKTGPDFDRAYLEQVQESHKASIESFTEAARDAKDSDVKTWAGLTVVALQSHLDSIDSAIAAL